ncbi:MAG: hypothetical protein P8R54_05615, partial [Myxococcota bacterium]|nr:hypothetical protein [Myxococcota bacterium]
RDFLLGQRLWPPLYEVSADAWKRKAEALRRQRSRVGQRAKSPARDQVLSLTAAAMHLPGNTDDVIAWLKTAVPLRPGTGKRLQRRVIWGDVLDALPHTRKP